MSESHHLTIAFCYDRKADYIAQGLTEEECAELEVDETIEAVTAALNELGHNVVKVGNIKSLVGFLAREEYKNWDLVFNITEGMYGVAREAQVPALLEAYRIPCVLSDAATLALCQDKAKTKLIVRHYGIPTAPFAIVNNSIETAKNSANSNFRGESAVAASPDCAELKFPLFAKPIAEGSSKGVIAGGKSNNKDELNSSVLHLCRQFPNQDILIENFLAGREITVGIIGTGDKAQVIGALENKKAENYANDFQTYEAKCSDEWRNYYQEIISNMNDPEVQHACAVALKAWRCLGCRDAGRIDMRFDKEGEGAVPHFIEVNPLAGIRPGYSQLPTIAKNNGISFNALLEMIIRSAQERM